MKYYSILKSGGSLFGEDNLVRAKNSKEALENFIGKKVKRVNEYYAPFDYSVSLSNELGQYYRDRRKTVYYNIIK